MRRRYSELNGLMGSQRLRSRRLAATVRLGPSRRLAQAPTGPKHGDSSAQMTRAICVQEFTTSSALYSLGQPLITPE